MGKVQIRVACAEDFEVVYGFINALVDEVFAKETQHDIFIKNILNPSNIYLIAFADRIAVGFLSCHVQHLLHHGGLIGEIQEMFVRAEARSLGVGRHLTDKLKEIAAARNILQLEVTSSIRREDAHRFYEREGFNQTHKKFVYKLK